MRKQLAVLAATAVLGVTSALAAHPFSDVTAQDWAYQAVERLVAEGVSKVIQMARSKVNVTSLVMKWHK